jgi:hypothetical protein
MTNLILLIEPLRKSAYFTELYFEIQGAFSLLSNMRVEFDTPLEVWYYSTSTHFFDVQFII